jgi:hypothetical protein
MVVAVMIALLAFALSAGAQEGGPEAEKTRVLKKTLGRFDRVDTELAHLEKLFLDEAARVQIAVLRLSGLNVLLDLQKIMGAPHFQPGELEAIQKLNGWLNELERTILAFRRRIAPEH